MNEELLPFDIQKKTPAIIKVIGVGGGGSNAVKNMSKHGIVGVDFIICNTDKQALDGSDIETKIQLGPTLTEGLGAGSIPDRGREAANESIEVIREHLEDSTKMIFITAGMGGGTGTGAAPVIASVAKELGKLTVGIVTIPFKYEGERRIKQAVEGIREMNNYVDALLVVNNTKIEEIYGDLPADDAFKHADNVLTVAAKGIAEIITVEGKINVDFADVETVMKKSGIALMGSGKAQGENRAAKAVDLALESPLLDSTDINGAKNLLINITYSSSHPATMGEISTINERVQDAAGNAADLIFGHSEDKSLGDSISVTIIATGFGERDIPSIYASMPEEFVTDVKHIEEPAEDTDFKSPVIIFDDETDEDNKKIHTEPEEEVTTDLSEEPFLEQDSIDNFTNINVEEQTVQTEVKKTSNTDNLLQNYKKNIAILEEVTAYERKKSSNSIINFERSKDEPSGTILGKDENGEPRFRENNSFLHDNSD